jgi:hypothetical protein
LKVKEYYHINFRDSFLILPSSLRKLAKAFNVENKGYFPFRFGNDPVVSLQYEGLTPNISFYDGIKDSLYQDLISNNWNLREETIKYCILDCVVLYQILSKFNELIFTKWNLNVHRFPTLSSLAFGIFRAHYLGEHKIPKLGGEIYDFIRQAYTGGRVDVFKPQGNDLYYYDVNSLYPTVYSSQAMPVGKPTYFKGDNLLEHYPDAFGFFKCKIEAPNDLNVPILQTHVETSAGKRTVAPLGSWTDVLFSEEMKNAISYGYKISVLEGFMFDKAVIFDKYAEDLFEIKQSHDSSHPMYLISKLLLNSLYGRFGMSLDLISHEVIDNRKLVKYIGKAKEFIPDIIDLNNGKSIVSKISSKNYERDCDTASMNVSIGIAAAITAYARIHMTPFLQDPSYNVYYSDTDSIVTDNTIDSKHIGSALGQMKLEYKINKAVFLAPKVYGIITDAGKEVTKVKGFKDSVSFEMLESLLVKDSALSLNQNKWFRDMGIGQIEIKNQNKTMKNVKDILKTLPAKVKAVPKVTKPKVTKIEIPQVSNTIDNAAKAVSIGSFILSILSYFTTIKGYIVKFILTPLLTLYLALINNPLYIIFKVFTKIYFLIYLITLIIGMYFLGVDQLTHNLMFIDAQNGFLSTIKEKISSIYKWILENWFGYKPVILNKYSELDYIDRINDALNVEINESKWYDFMKSPWFYAPLIIGSCCLIYYKFDVIYDWFTRGGPDVNPDPDAPNPVARAVLNPTDVPNNVTSRPPIHSSSLHNSFHQSLAEHLNIKGFKSNLEVKPINTDINLIDLRTQSSPTDSIASTSSI